MFAPGSLATVAVVLALAGTGPDPLSLAACMAASRQADGQEFRVPLAYGAPGGKGPAPNFSPKGTQVPLADVPGAAALPEGAIRPAKTGTIRIGPGRQSWLGVLVTADADHPKDLCRVFLDRNRNGRFDDEGTPLTATPAVREKTGDVWSSFSRVEVPVPYAGGVTEPYMISIWLVRQGDEAPGVLRYSVSSWRSGTATIAGVEAFVAAMDANNDAVFDKADMWSVLEAGVPDAPKQVLSIAEARATDRLMFVRDGAKDLVLEFRGFSPDGRSVTFALVDRPVTKAEDRAGDDTVAAERGRPRATTPFPWETAFDAALARAKATNRRVIVDFWTSWCGPCRTMDEWIWSDAEVAARLNAGFVGVKLDGDIEKALVSRFAVQGYPTVLVLDSSGREMERFAGYKSSREVLEILTPKR